MSSRLGNTVVIGLWMLAAWTGCGLPPGVASSPEGPHAPGSEPGPGVSPEEDNGEPPRLPFPFPRTPVEGEEELDPPAGIPGLSVSSHLALGFPDDASVGNPSRWLLVRPQWAASYDTKKKAPLWASWTLTAADLGQATRASTFRVDPLLPSESLQASNEDYTASGFNRGHLCPSADRTATDSDNDATFFLTNVVPQVTASNSGPWLELENEARALARAGKSLLIVAGALFEADRTIGSGVNVPEAMFKVVVVLEEAPVPEAVTPETRVLAVIIPNDAGASEKRWREWQVTVDEIEKRSGLNLLSDVPRDVQAALESRRDL